jgi:hypothetical protein
MKDDNWIRGFDGKILVPNSRDFSFQFRIVIGLIIFFILVWLTSG